MTSSAARRMRQLVDWSAAVWAGSIAGTVFLLLNLFLIPAMVGGNAWTIVRLFASILLGEGVLAPPATASVPALGAALVAHYALSVVFALVIAWILHRWGIVIGVIGGALLGLALYCINFYTLTLAYPWFYAMRNGVFVFTHVVYGALAGGIYEALEVEEFVPAEPEVRNETKEA